MLNADIANQFRFELDADERILWAGQPRQGFMLHGYDLFQIPFSLLWGGFAIFWFVTALLADAPFFFALFGLPFVLIGLYLIAGRFVHDAWTRRHTYYAITDRRVLIRRGSQNASLSSFNLAALSETAFQEHRNGRGTILFNNTMMPAGRVYSFNQSSRYMPCFDQVENGRQVHQILRRAQQEAIQFPTH